MRLQERRLVHDRQQEIMIRRQLEAEHSRREQEMMRRMQEARDREARWVGLDKITVFYYPPAYPSLDPAYIHVGGEYI